VSAATGPSPVGTLEKRYLDGIFAGLCRIESPSLHERACAERVIAELAALGVEVLEDDAGGRIGGDCGNLLARIAPPAPAAAGGESAGSGERACVLLCAHLDTVPPSGPIEPLLHEGVWENEGEGILGADNKAAVAVLLALARHVVHAGTPLEVELLFTVAEEPSLMGSSAFDAAALRSDFGYVFDHASPIGEVIVDSPCLYRVQSVFHGLAAHAGICPERGRSAILAASHAVASLRHGRIEGEGTVNAGTIAGGSAINVVPERCELLVEVRGEDDRRGEALVAEVVDRVHEAANDPEWECDVDVSVQRMFAGYRHAPSMPALRVAESALRACGHEPVRISSGGGSDANALLAKGLPTVNLANGTERAHEPGERVTAQALSETLDLALALLDEAVTLTPDLAR
jgi:tripeptide aminopeptidase